MFKRPGRIAASKPSARTEGLSITRSGRETLVYDRKNFTIRRLSPELAAVWHLADGTRDTDALKSESGYRNVDEALQVLTEMGLMTGVPIRKSLLSRRRVIAGASGAVAAGVLIAPAAASAVEGGDCTVPDVRYDVHCGTDHAGHLECMATDDPPGSWNGVWYCQG